MSHTENLSLLIGGESLALDYVEDDPLRRAVVISLFTWRRARPDDVLPADQRQGWWGDNHAAVAGDRIGSRLWLLSREKVTQQTILRAREYGAEALAWLVEDRVAARVDVTAARAGIFAISLTVVITRHDGSRLELRFADVWEKLNG